MKLSYNGNTQLKPANAEIPFPQEYIDEYIKCQQSYEYFIENYNYIVSLNGQDLVKIKLYDYQKKLIKVIDENKYTISKMPRQCGKTTSVGMYVVWCIIFKHNYSVGIAADKDVTAKEIIERIQTAYENLPMWLQQGVKTWNDHNIKLENGSKVTATATTKKTFRGQSHNLILLDEFAFVEKGIADQFYGSVYPVVSSSPKAKMVIISTPKGLNHYYKLWKDAENGNNTFKPVDVMWNDVPGRGDEFRKETIANIGQERWLQEFCCDFQGNTNSLVSETTLKNIPIENTIRESENVKFYDFPVTGNQYFMAVDTSEAKGLDYHAFVVLDITKRPFEVVCTFKCNTTPVLLYPSIIYRIASYYNNAFVLIETKSSGEQVADMLFHDNEYENILGAEKKGASGQVLTLYRNKAKGISTSVRTKNIGCSNLKLLAESEQLIFKDEDLITELKNFQLKGRSYQAASGYNDDLVMCLVTFAWATSQTFFSEISDSGDVKQILKEKIKEIEEDLLPFGVILDGMNDNNFF